MEHRNNYRDPMPNGISILSIISLLVSIDGILAYRACFNNGFYIPVFVGLGVASIILPIVAKKYRITNNKTGRRMEIIAIIVGGFDFYGIIFALTSFPLYVGYMGWVVCSIVYRLVG